MTGKENNNPRELARQGKPEMPEPPNLLEDFGGALLQGIPGALPVVGSMFSGMMASGMDFNYKAKMHQIVEYILIELEGLSQRVGWAPEALVQDEQFAAYLTRAVWQAAETVEEDKLRALAMASINSGSWSPIEGAEREFYWRLLRQYTSLHLQTLKALHSTQVPEMGGGDGVRLEDFFRTVIGFPAFHEDIGDAVLSDLARDGLTRNGFGRGYPFSSGSSDLSPLGGSFLEFLDETGS
ncbi:hypothetical protein [Glutamicibacter nicotianae]|uniref:hypothetical protein n=1 Tax=Glutamicibacter nicotianae TaxID=37929 RepID=UPI00167F9657|nr:hypothetical protein [Glutamicibacter nicotianae]